MNKLLSGLLILAGLLGLVGCAGGQSLSRVGGKRSLMGYSIDLEGDRVYIASNQGFLIYRLQTPASAVEIGKFEAEPSFGIDVEGDLVYLASHNQLVIVDAADAAHPRQLGTYQIDGIAIAVALEGDYAYLSGSSGGFILDVQDPYDPSLISRFAPGSYVSSVEVWDSTLYAALPSRGVQVFDISDPSSPELMATVPGTRGVEDLQMGEGYLYAACHQLGVKVISSGGAEARVVGSYRDDDGGEALAVWEGDGILFVADNFQVEALDIQDPTHLREIGEYRRISAAHDLVGSGSYLYIAAGGFFVLEFELEG